MTKVIVVNGRSTLKIRVVYRGRLRPDLSPGLLANVELDLEPPSRYVENSDFQITLVRGSTDPSASDGVQLIDYREKRVRCPGLRGRVRPRHRTLMFTVPQSCFAGKAGRVRIAGYTYRIRGTATEADYIDSWSRWIARA